MREFFLDRVQEESVLSGQAFMYLHYADMIANGYNRTMPCPFQRQGLLLNPNGDLFYCENSQKLGNALDTPAADLYFGAENLAHREKLKRDTCPTCLSPCQVNVGGDEAGRPVREVPAPRLQGQARSVPAPRHVAHPGALTAAIADPQVRLRFGTLLRFAVAVGLTAWIVWQADLTAIAAAFSRTSWAWIGAACLLVLFDRLLMAWRWIGLLDVLQARRPPVRSLLRTFFVSTFLGTFLVQTVGSDAIRTWSLARDGVPASESLASVLMDRMLGVVSLLISAAVGVALVPSVLGQPGVVWPFVLAAAGCTFAIAFVFSTRLDNAARQWLGRLRPGRVPHAAGDGSSTRCRPTARGVVCWPASSSLRSPCRPCASGRLGCSAGAWDWRRRHRAISRSSRSSCW